MVEAPPRSRGSQSLVITILGCHMRGAGDRAWSGGLVELIGEFGFSVDAARAALARLVTKGLLTRHRNGRMIDYVLTPLADELLREGDRRIFAFGRRSPEADSWTFLWHEIPADWRMERSRLGQSLRFLGFGPLQDATWIAAHDREDEARALIAQRGVADYVAIFLGALAGGSDKAILSSSAWDLDGLTQQYDKFLTEFAPLAEDGTKPSMTDREAFIARIRLMHSFRDFSHLDPELPDSVAPLHDLRSRAVTVFDAAYEGTGEAARRYFEQVTGRAGRPSDG